MATTRIGLNLSGPLPPWRLNSARFLVSAPPTNVANVGFAPTPSGDKESAVADLGPYEWMRQVMGDQEAEEVYAELANGGSMTGRAAAGIASYWAREYWPDFFAVADRPALAACAQLFDDYPWLTPALAERAIAALRGRVAISPPDIVEAAQLLDDEP